MSNSHNVVLSEPRYEFRIWGSHPEVGRRLAAWADAESQQELEDCYLLFGGYSYNAKIRGRRLKIKSLVRSCHGFEQWSAVRHDLAFEPDELEQLGRRVTAMGRAGPSVRELPQLVKPSLRFGWDGDAVVVAKRRQRFLLGAMKAEVTTMDLVGLDSPLHSVAIEGRELPDLVDLRQALGIAKLPNRAVHLAVADWYRASAPADDGPWTRFSSTAV